MSDVYALADEQRAGLAVLDRVTAQRMAATYTVLLANAQRDRAALIKKLVIWQAAHPSVDPRGASPSRHWVFQQERYKQLEQQLGASLNIYAGVSAGAISDAQEAAMRMVQASQPSMIAGALGGGDRAAGALSLAILPEQAINAVVGFASDGTPLHTLLSQRSRDAGAATTATLVDGIAFGRGPRAMATAMDDQLNELHWQNLRIARTEMMRAYREGQRVNMLQNANVLNGWRWSSAADRRSCAICLGQQGQTYPIDMVKPGDVPPDIAQHQGLSDALAKAPTGGKGTIEKDAVLV